MGPPGQGKSKPFIFDYSLKDAATWLYEILGQEHMSAAVLLGHSMGGHLGQVFADLYPGKMAGFIALNSSPISKKYWTSWEVWMLRKMKIIYRLYPWKTLIKLASKGSAETRYGQSLMEEMMGSYEDKTQNVQVACHGFEILAQAIEVGLDYKISCPALLLCGDKDRTGSTKDKNLAWSRESQIPLYWVRGGGHNANTDRPEEVNKLIENFIKALSQGKER